MLFDGGCGLCVRTVQVLRRLDVRDRIDVLDVTHNWPAIAARIPSLSREACLEDLHVIAPDGRVEVGFAAYRAMAHAVPLAWPVLPLLYLPGAKAVGERVYRAVARHRLTSSCEIEPATMRSPYPPQQP